MFSILSMGHARGKASRKDKMVIHDRHDDEEEEKEVPEEEVTPTTTTTTTAATTPIPRLATHHNPPKSKKENRVSKQIHALKSILDSIRSWNTTGHEEMSWWLQFLNRSCEPYSHLYSIGSSVQNRELWVIALSDHPEIHEIGEPEVKIIGNIHGNENVGREVILHMVDHICANIDSDPDLRAIVENIRIHFLPSLNPDGIFDLLFRL
ncbi:Carboxypeptidase D [Thelohanellus kitauei]|uniref:Carboxypeptidase D n=1 Tax=Thelohanellus kitauei TaxID=669202 RepID=A0A0C2J9R5_THEKT|nr:Carboxypeptidase D [Thelohanellus kitauei]